MAERDQRQGSKDSKRNRSKKTPEELAKEQAIQEFKETLKVPEVEFSTQLLVPEDAGPRPDEELIQAVKIEGALGSRASIERVYEIIHGESDKEVNQRSVGGFTPLMVAAAQGHSELLALLLERHADVAMKSTHSHELPLHYAVRNGDRVVTQMLAAKSDELGLIDAPNVTGWPPIHLAAAAGSGQAIRILLRHSADINGKNDAQGGFAPLHVACQMGLNETAEMLIDWDADVQQTENSGRQALAFACEKGHLPTVSLLLRCKCDPLRAGPGGKLPKDYVPEGNPKLLNLLEAYSRPPPTPRRTDLRFDIPDRRDC